MSALTPPSPAVQALIDAFRSADARVKDLISKQQSLDAQLTENNMVKTELDALKEGEPVYKLQGKLLVLHEPADALDTVNRRIAMITGEMCAPARALNRPKISNSYPSAPRRTARPTNPRRGKLGKLIAEGQQQVQKLRTEIGAAQQEAGRAGGGSE